MGNSVPHGWVRIVKTNDLTRFESKLNALFSTCSQIQLDNPLSLIRAHAPESLKLVKTIYEQKMGYFIEYTHDTNDNDNGPDHSYLVTCELAFDQIPDHVYFVYGKPKVFHQLAETLTAELADSKTRLRTESKHRKRPPAIKTDNFKPKPKPRSFNQTKISPNTSSNVSFCHTNIHVVSKPNVKVSSIT